MVQATTTTVILATWERAYSLAPIDRGLALLNLARPGESFVSLATWTIGERDAALLDLRASLFGCEIQSLDSCPECSEKIEVSFNLNDIRITPPTVPGPHQISVAGETVSIRAATSADLISVARAPSPTARRQAVLARCLSGDSGTAENTACTGIGDLSESGLRAVADKLSEIDPQADVRIALDCAQCGHAWSSRFDIANYLWSEIDVWAQRLLSEVHTLAFAYGWAERDILKMSAWRRQIYLGMLRR